jgi:RecB family exonuclease
VDDDEDGYVIVDYKSGNPKSQDAADTSVQLSVYALAMGARKAVKKLIFQNLENNSTVESARTVEQLHEAETQVAEVAAGIAAAQFDAKPGSHCNWCAYRSICPEIELSVQLLPGEAIKG